jgi:aryl-alcohol dehydrogenase-like predicted oxidoreductase
MDVRNLGTAGLVSSAIGLGTAAFSGIYGPVSKRECQETILLALDLGITMFDTSDIYSGGEIEVLLGRALSHRRRDALIAVHGGMRISAAGDAPVVDGSPGYLAAACDASLRRLNTDFIDIYYLSRVDPRVPVEDSVGKLAELVAAGKIRYVGLCEPSAAYLRRAHAAYPVSALAVEYSLWRRSRERGLLDLAAELSVGVVACCPLARGRLAGDNTLAASAREQAALRSVATEAAELDLGLARLALAWLLTCRNNVVPVPSTRSLAHLEMNASAASIELLPGTCARLSQLFPC